MIYLILIILLSFILRLYFYDKSQGENLVGIFFSIFNGIFSIKYFLVNPIQANDSKNQLLQKKISNILLYIFYILLIILMVYAVFIIISE